MNVRVCCILLLALISQCAFSQNPAPDTILVVGQVLEEDSYSGLPFAHVRVGEKATTTDFAGIFRIKVNNEDTVHISYVGYKPRWFTLPPDLHTPLYETKVALERDTILLSDANITILPASIEAFKQAILSMELSDREYQNVAQNMEAMARQVSVYSYDKYLMDAGENQRAALAGPQGFNFLRVFKKLSEALRPEQPETRPSPTPVYYHPTNTPDSLSYTDSFFLQRPDSTLNNIDN